MITIIIIIIIVVVIIITTTIITMVTLIISLKRPIDYHNNSCRSAGLPTRESVGGVRLPDGDLAALRAQGQPRLFFV